MGDFAKAVSALRSVGVGVTVENYDGGIQEARIDGDNMTGGMTKRMKSVTFDEEEVDIIRELLTVIACGYERETYHHHCCDANEVIAKIDSIIGKEDEEG